MYDTSRFPHDYMMCGCLVDQSATDQNSQKPESGSFRQTSGTLPEQSRRQPRMVCLQIRFLFAAVGDLCPELNGPPSNNVLTAPNTRLVCIPERSPTHSYFRNKRTRNSRNDSTRAALQPVTKTAQSKGLHYGQQLLRERLDRCRLLAMWKHAMMADGCSLPLHIVPTYRTTCDRSRFTLRLPVCRNVKRRDGFTRPQHKRIRTRKNKTDNNSAAQRNTRAMNDCLCTSVMEKKREKIKKGLQNAYYLLNQSFRRNTRREIFQLFRQRSPTKKRTGGDFPQGGTRREKAVTERTDNLTLHMTLTAIQQEGPKGPPAPPLQPPRSQTGSSKNATK